MSARKFDLYKAKCYGNVAVSKDVTLINNIEHVKIFVELHGNLVVSLDLTKKIFRLDHCGWITSTTATAINTALKQFNPSVSVFRRKGEMYVSFANGEEIGLLDPKAWYRFDRKEAA